MTLDEATRLLNATQLMLLGGDNQPISDLYYALQIAVDSIEELKERIEADRWISVDEALPEKEGWYLVDRKERTFTIQYFFFDTADHKPYWASECKVYYWRPLPEAYKESEGE